MGEKISLHFDESGNMGSQGKYFTIACVQTTNVKPLKNVMKKAVVKTKEVFPKFQRHNEIKASDASMIIKDYFLRKIVSKESVSVRYVVADKQHVNPKLLEDENLLYNFMLQFIVLAVVKNHDVEELEINLDKRSIKVASGNSFEDYIKIKVNYELNLDVNITVNYFESQNSYAIQAADFVANAVNTKYEYGTDHCHCYDLLNEKIIQSELFPRRHFGKQKVVAL
ncbi:DUF3800 domain-containing protein [Planococcus sp. CP5-4]|uniref:DUF3800 domain-containing protein n=1 Tax=unclassified Planococcus (in: firmicutes) TaxID=2662419 RepID=UPI001C22F386|nr:MULTISPECIES: DUF3800 domain-containing protein [unclassified Planococcus (in: firmicutes)]MBU9674666.1 DUF3800 domain-containing protein [Planococcus sp. CP5-4_YE]MBV0910183.1 DUF3800 domain-containing protein [Planococcus sp. CP5-4_UN]MBW6064977.1 DUF3800 domain-containing protein [Planococcus sp. CP5-4]